MIIRQLVIQQKATGQTRRWFWHTLDSRKRVQHTSEGSHPNGWANLAQLVQNVEALLGDEVELFKVRGEYACGRVNGRPAIDVRVER